MLSKNNTNKLILKIGVLHPEGMCLQDPFTEAIYHKKVTFFLGRSLILGIVGL